jgi:copper homeostasis protein
MKAITFELCAETLQSCLAARKGGAHRIELCSALSEDGLTPSHGLICAAVEQSGLPIHVLLRPRGGGFVYTASEFAFICDDMKHAGDLGASGFVVGVLQADGTIDLDRTNELVELAAPLEVTFHRAFDLTPVLDASLEAIIAAGCRRVLTSGGEPDVVAGSVHLARLVKQAAGRIDIAVGGGLRLSNAALVARSTLASHFHGSMRRQVKLTATSSRSDVLTSQNHEYVVNPEDIQAIVAALNES